MDLVLLPFYRCFRKKEVLDDKGANEDEMTEEGTKEQKGSVAELAERQLPSGVTGVRSLPAAPSRCGRVTSVLNSLVG